MKKLSFIAFLLCLVTVFSACTFIDPTDTTTEQPTDTEEQTEAVDPGPVWGIWYSKTNQTVVQISEDLSSAVFYMLHLGYYEYEIKIEGSCRYEDFIVTLTPQEGQSYSWLYNEKTGVLTANYGNDTSAYARIETVPTAYTAPTFPKFEDLACESLVNLGTYQGLTLPSRDDTTADAVLEIFEDYYAANKDKTPGTVADRPAAKGDRVNIDYKGLLDGVAFEGGTAEGVDLSIVSDSGYIPGFVEGIIGQTVGSEFDVPVTFPENYHSADMAGKSVIFKMKLNKIYDTSISDADVSAWKEGEYETYSALLDDVVLDAEKDQVFNQVLAAASCPEMTEQMYDFFAAYYRDMYHYYAYYYGMEYEVLLSYYGLTDADFVEQAKSEALTFMTAYAIAAKEDISYTEDALNDRIEEAVQSLMQEDYSRAEALEYVNETELSLIKAELIVSVVRDFLHQSAVAPTANE